MSEPVLTQLEADHYRLNGVLDFSTVPLFQSQGVQLLHGDKDVTLDLSGIERGNSAALLLLINWTRLAQQKNRTIHYTNVPQQIISLVQVSGLQELLSIKCEKLSQ